MEEKRLKSKNNENVQKNNRQTKLKISKKVENQKNCDRDKTQTVKKSSGKTKELTVLQKNEKSQRKNLSSGKANSFLTKIAVRIVTIVLLAMFFLIAGTIAIKKITKVNYEAKFTVVNQQLLFCQELITMKFQYSDIVSLKKSMGLSKSYSIVKYNGIIRVGIEDLSQTDVKITKDGKEVRIKLPPVSILGNEITKQEVFDEKQSIFVPITTQEIFEEIENAKIQMQEDMIAEGLIEEAQKYTEKIISIMTIFHVFPHFNSPQPNLNLRKRIKDIQ